MLSAIFVISLPGSETRQQAIAAQLAQHALPFSWLEGVNGRNLEAAALAEAYSMLRAEEEGGRQLSAGEIGCAMSHQKIYQTILDQELDLALVLEDDAALDPSFAERLDEVIDATDWHAVDLVLLSHVQKYTAWGGRRIGAALRLVRPLVAYNGNGYLITRRGAEKLLAVLRPIYQPADCWNHLQDIGALTIRAVVPYLVNHSHLSVDSLIGNVLRTETRHVATNKLVLRVLKRVFYDKFIYQILVKPVMRIHKQPMPW